MAVQRAKKHLIDFEIATDPDYEPNWHHEKIALELEHIFQNGDSEYKILIITVPPRHGKSRECSIDFPAWVLGNDPKKEIMIACHSASLAEEFGGKTRDRVDDVPFKVIFPNVRLREDQKARGRWNTRQGGGYMATGVGGPITGRGAHIFLIDDAIKNREEAESEVYREKTWDWFRGVAFTRLHPKGVMVIIMTRWHPDDLVGRILAAEEFDGLVKIMKFPAIANVSGKNRKEGEALWPDRYDLDELLERKKVVGPYEFAAQFQCDPVLTEKQEFKPEWYKDIGEDELASKETANYLTVDTAMSKKSQADYCGFVDNSVDRENFWNVKAWRARLGPEELVDNLFALHETRKYSAIGIEKTAYTDGLKPFLDAEQRKRNKFLPIVELKHNQTAKEIRIRGLIPRYASGSIRHVRGRCDDLLEEQMSFPYGVHDDVLDALAYQSQVAGEKKKGVKIHIPKNPGGFSRFRR